MTCGDETMIGQKIRRGMPGGPAPTITGVIWRGTASVTAYDEHRLPAAIVDTDRGRYAVVQMYGTTFDLDCWWDARLVRSREWETIDGLLVGDVDPNVAAEIDDILATADDTHEYYYRRLCDRILAATFWVVDPNE